MKMIIDNMESHYWYTILLGALVGLWALMSLALLALDILHRRVSNGRYALHSLIPYSRRHLPNLTWLHVCIFVLYLAGNILSLALGDLSLATMKNKTGYLSLANLIPLGITGRSNFVTQFLGTELQTTQMIHRWTAIAALTHGLIHSGIHIFRNNPISTIDNKRAISGYTAAATLLCMIVLSVGIIRRRCFEIFSTVHIVFGVTTITALAIHIQLFALNGPAAGCLYAVLSIWMIAITGRLWQIVYSSRGCRVSVETLDTGSALRLTLDLRSSGTTFRPGQYVYLRIPRVGLSGIFQSHPFIVVWWDERRAFLLIQPQNGFSRRLLSYNGRRLKAFIEGPFGSPSKESTLANHGTVLLVASGIGIAAILPFVKQLCAGYHRREVRTRKICLSWYIERAEYTHWLDPWMENLTSSDNHRILEIRIHIRDLRSLPANWANATRSTEAGALQNIHKVGKTNTIIRTAGYPISIEDEISQAVTNVPGEILLSVCATQEVTDRVLECAQTLSRNGHNLAVEKLNLFPVPNAPPTLETSVMPC